MARAKPEDRGIRVRGRDLRATVGDTEYEWNGGLDAVLVSSERGVRRYEVRAIGNQLFQASWIRPRGWRKPEVTWSPVCAIDVEWLNEFRARLFGVWS